jgi:hypothetical protein
MSQKLYFYRFATAIFTSILSIILSSLTWITFAQPSPTRPQPQTPPGTNPPPPSRPEAVCPTTEIPIFGLFENEGYDVTTVAQPTFFIYVPYTAEEVSYMEFFVLDKNEVETIYAAAIPPLEEAGIVKISLPPEYSLNLNELYRWYFYVSCHPTTNQTPDLKISGWIRFIDNIAENTVGYDRVNAVIGDRDFISPEDTDWLTLRAEFEQIEQYLPNQEYTIIEPELLPLTN